jgi:hypothetical protein
MLRTYMTNFPGSFVGFFVALSDVLDFLNKEWTEYGRKDYGDVFKAVSDQCRGISVQLKKLHEEHEAEQSASIDPLVAIQEHLNTVKKVVG